MSRILQDPIITHIERTGYWYGDGGDELPVYICINCGEQIDPYDLDAYIGEYDECTCGKCMELLYKEDE